MADSSAADARLPMAPVTTYIDDIARSPRLVADDGVREEVVAVAFASLGSQDRAE